MVMSNSSEIMQGCKICTCKTAGEPLIVPGKMHDIKRKNKIINVPQKLLM